MLFRRRKGVKVLEIGAQSVELHPDVVASEEAIVRFGLAENDVFKTPPEAHAIASEAVGWITATAMDPCAAPADIGRDANGKLVDGLCLRFASQTFCNPPFSRGEYNSMYSCALARHL